MTQRTQYPPLEEVVKPLLTTSEFCHYSNLARSTAWVWSCRGGKVNPIRIGSRLGWPTAAVKELCGVPA
jgi:predicted DNA-binding transcriptional regulator AlpA